MWLYDAFRFIILTNLGALMLCFKLPRRKYWHIYALCVLVLNVVVIICLNYIGKRVSKGSLLLSSGTYFLQYASTFVLVLVTFDCRLLTTFFCSTVGYCLQHLTMRIVGLFIQLFRIPNKLLYAMPMQVILAVLIYFISGYIFYRRNGFKNKEIVVRNPVQLIISACALCVMVVIEDAMIPFVFSIEERIMVVANFISSVIFALLILVLEFNVLVKDEYQNELEVTRQIAAREREQYLLEKSVVDTINIKCHDLKHQLNILNGKISDEEINKIKEAVDVYDSTYKTGNTALDVVITMKSLVCMNKKIEFTCLIDGTKLNFMQEWDIYSMFGNILDNAIEAVEKVENLEKRVISLSMKEKKSMLFLRLENYFNGVPHLIDGLPITTKADTAYHGFGLKSIRNVVQKYGGNLRLDIKDDTFALDIMFFDIQSK